MAAARAPPLFHNLSNPKHYNSHKTQKIKLNLTSSLNSQKISYLPALSYLQNDEGKSRKSSILLNHAYVSGPAFIVSENDLKIDDSGGDEIPELQPVHLISWGIRDCCTPNIYGRFCSIFGRFFEVLLGARPEPIWQVLSKVGILHLVEPIFTIIFVINMNAMWEKVLSSLRAQIFQSVLIQGGNFDIYKVGELTALLTSDLGSLKGIVGDNISRDPGFRAIFEVIGTLCLLFALSFQLAPILGVLMFTVSLLVAVHKRTTVNVFKAHGSAQASIADCVTETFAAICTVRSFGGEKRQMSIFGHQILNYEDSGMKLGKFKSINESLTQIAVVNFLWERWCLLLDTISR